VTPCSQNFLTLWWSVLPPSLVSVCKAIKKKGSSKQNTPLACLLLWPRRWRHYIPPNHL
jgi:hypothetical protein